MKHLLWLAPALFATACSSPPPQVITGRISQDFPSQITHVKVTTSSIQSWHGNALAAEVPVAADGTFRVEVPPMRGVHIQLLSADGQSSVVFPRLAGGMQHGFEIRPYGSPVDLGMIRFVGNATTTPVVFKTSGMDPECQDDGEDASGSMCIDDQDNNNDNNQCGQNDDGETNDGENSNADDGNLNAESDGVEDGSDGADVGDSMAEHNFPADGCEGDNGGGDNGGDNSGDNSED